jgi:hypothetical protein
MSNNHTSIANRRRQTALGNIEDHLRSGHMGDPKAWTAEVTAHVLKHKKEASTLNDRIKNQAKFRKYINVKPRVVQAVRENTTPVGAQ